MSLVKGKCLSCNAEITYGPIVVKDGKKVPTKYELDGKTTHVCRPKEKGFQRAPQKPRQTFGYDYSIDENGKAWEIYWSKIEGYLGEIKADAAFNDMHASVSTYLKMKERK